MSYMDKSLTKKDLFSYFEKYGTVEDVVISTPWLCYAHVTFHDAQAAQRLYGKRHKVRGVDLLTKSGKTREEHRYFEIVGREVNKRKKALNLHHISPLSVDGRRPELELNGRVFWCSLPSKLLNSEVSCGNGCCDVPAEPRRCKTCVPVSGNLPNTGWQVAALRLLHQHWVQLLLLRGHQGEGSRSLGKPQEEEEDPINSETRCQEQRRFSEPEA